MRTVLQGAKVKGESGIGVVVAPEMEDHSGRGNPLVILPFDEGLSHSSRSFHCFGVMFADGS